MWSCSASTSVSRSGAAGIASSVRSAPTRRWRKSARVRRCTSASPSSSPGAAITKSTRVLSGLRRSTVSAVILAPVIMENAKNASPTMSQRAWKLPIPSPMRSNQPSVRTASSEKTRSFAMIVWRGGSHGARALSSGPNRRPSAGSGLLLCLYYFAQKGVRMGAVVVVECIEQRTGELDAVLILRLDARLAHLPLGEGPGLAVLPHVVPLLGEVVAADPGVLVEPLGHQPELLHGGDRG